MQSGSTDTQEQVRVYRCCVHSLPPLRKGNTPPAFLKQLNIQKSNHRGANVVISVFLSALTMCSPTLQFFLKSESVCRIFSPEVLGLSSSPEQ